MLSPLDLQNRKVKTKKRKYDKAEMDEYLELVFENYKEAFNENQELKKDVKTLSDGIQYYRSIEATMQKALVLAEKTAKETKDAAVLKAEAIEKDANAKAEKIVTEAEQEYEKIKEKCLYLVQQFNQYKMQLKQVANAQLELITSESFDVYAPEIEDLQTNSTKQVFAAESSEPIVASTVEEPLEVNTVEDKLEDLEMEVDTLDKTMEIPNLKKEKKNLDKPTEDETISILTADTIDLSDSIQKVKESEGANNIQKPIDATPKSVQDAFVVEPIEAELNTPLDAQLEEATVAEPDILETIEPVVETKESPTLDSLLQSMNMSKKNKSKKGQDEDPFEFLGSVDDF